MCSQRLDISQHPCLENQSKCEVEIKSYNTTQLRITDFGLLIATTANYTIFAQSVTTKIAKTINGAYFIQYNFLNAIVCSDETSISSFILTPDYTIKYTEPYVHRLPQELHENKVDDWTDYQELKKLETGLVKQLIAWYISFSKRNYQYIWLILTIALVILYCATISVVIYYWFKTCQ